MTLNNNGILFDHGRTARIGLPEAVFCEGKSQAAIEALMLAFAKQSRPILFTRLTADVYQALPEMITKEYDYHELSRTAYSATLESSGQGRVAVVSAGTADGSVTWEAIRTLEYLGVEHGIFEDNGVAGLWRLMDNLKHINACDVIIAVAGLDAALISVLGGLTAKPIIGVPTSVGYGLAKKGEAALASMLISCAQGVTVMNIDNGFGAACAAARIMNLMESVLSARIDEQARMVKLAV